MAPVKRDYKQAATEAPASAAASSYRDDADAVSMHTTRSDYEYDDAPQLPSYSDSIAADGSSQQATREPPPADEYAVITKPPPRSWRGRAKRDCATTSAALGSETSLRMDDRLLDASTLFDYTDKYLRRIPPRPCIRIQGWHHETRRDKDNKTSKDRVDDFDIVFNMQAYFPAACDTRWSYADTVENSDKTHRGGFHKTRAPGYKQDIEVGSDSKPELMDWCENFADHKSALRIFRVSRSVVGWNTEFLKDNIVPLIRSTHYRGNIDISFPVADKNVDIFTPHWINRWRITWVRWIFYLTFLWIFTWPVLFFLTKRWNVYRVEWRYSQTVTNEQGHLETKYCSVSERTWLQKHSNLIQSLVLDKFHGDGTELPVNVEVNVDRRRGGVNLPLTGNGNVDSAVSFIQGSVGAWNALNGRGSVGGWGADS